jgi:hypothetical protein
MDFSKRCARLSPLSAIPTSASQKTDHEEKNGKTILFISRPENPRLSSLGMNGTRNEASEAGEVEANPA